METSTEIMAVIDEIKKGQGAAELRATSNIKEDGMVNVIFDYSGQLLLCKLNPQLGELQRQGMWINEDQVSLYV